ncbi:hypothetical protein [Kitasatospora xanthocidica]|uniref:hypothetical protein n=1 Tax=Kitasatospora xanthocidica TaxID=83382 RepID=UPI0011C4A85B|nr:hypothetical protein [Kitasatospora xanthocidica]
MTVHFHLTRSAAAADGQDCQFDTTALGLNSLRETMRGFGMLTDYQPLLWPDLDGPERRRLFQEDPDSADPNPGGIPDSKLTRPGRWRISAAEITAALATYDAAPAEVRLAVEDPDDGYPAWVRWIAFLRLAAGHDGIARRT